MRQSTTAAVTILIISLILLFLINISLGSVQIPLATLFKSFYSQTGITSEILWQFRLPRAITCILAGSALATGGLLMQTLFRNPMAGPDVLGLTSGASLMVALVLMLGQAGAIIFNSPWSIAIAASLGGALVFVLIIGLAHYIKDNVSLLIVGLMISAATSSIVSVLQFTSQADDLQAFMIWMLGSVGGTTWNEIMVLALLVLIGIGLSFRLIKPLNSLLLGENYALGLKINIRQARFWTVVATGMMTGAVTAFCGPIAFVGLAVPHLVRLLMPVANHKILIPGVAVGGAALLLACDILAQLPGSTQVLPLNAITSLIGAPIVIALILKAKRIHV